MCAFFFLSLYPFPFYPLPFFSTRFDQNWLREVFCFLFHVVVLVWLVLSAYWTNSFFLSVCHCLSSFFFCDRRRMKMTETWLLIVRCPSRIDSLCLCADENINAFSLNFDILLNWWKNLSSSHGSIVTWMNVDWSPTFIFWMVFVHVWEKHILPQFERNFWLCKFAFWIYRVVICHLSIVICHFLVLRVSQCLFLDTWNSLLISFANFVC